MKPNRLLASSLFARSLLFSVTILFCLSARSQDLLWKYDLKAGDHLVYRYSFERRVSGGETESLSRASYTSHVLILAEKDGHFSVGFQRNRESAELVSYREKGKDKLSEQKADFDARMAKRDAHFHEANEFDRSGNNFDFWVAARESPSKVLLGVHEIVDLPDHKVGISDKWRGHDLLGFDSHFAGMENVGGKSCARVDGRNGVGRISYWWCPESGVLGKVEFDGEYVLFGDARAHEKLTFELVEKRRGESVGDWLESADTQRGALDALLLSRWAPLPTDFGGLSLESQAPDVQALMLSLIYQRRGHVLKNDLLVKLSHSENLEVARIAGQMLDVSSAAGKAFPPERLGTSFRVSQRQRLPYILHVPKDYRGDRPFPLIIYLSGGAGLAIDAANSSEDVIAPTGYLALYPQAGDMWWNDDIRDKFASLFDETLDTLNVDRSRIYITGFSNGGTGALYYASLWPKRFAAVVTMMGAGVCMPEVSRRLSEARDIPTLLLHGDKDPIIPVSCSRDTFNALKKASKNVPPQLKIFPGKGHEITLQSDEGETLKFFEGKRVAK
ncbi:MAG TPA: prolyl oligopeptidase family serine peptidase [Terriglobales bacterium]|jgi:acetyl esterase/lipase|nr:prolyl oligopeptidase family serine peptidase [Terriglobales bacterium]